MDAMQHNVLSSIPKYFVCSLEDQLEYTESEQCPLTINVPTSSLAFWDNRCRDACSYSHRWWLTRQR